MERNSKRMAGSLRKSAYIPPYWFNLAVALFFLVAGLCAWSSPSTSRAVKYDGARNFLAPVGLALLFQGCFHYSIHKFGILVHFMWIPVRVIKWEKVFAAEYIHEWCYRPKHNDTNKGHGIMVTLLGCPVYCAEIDVMYAFRWRHPWGAHFIRFSKRKRKRIVQVFQQYYPNLRFQVGCDTSWLTDEEK